MLRIILIVLSFPLKPVIRRVKRATNRIANRIRIEIDLAIITVNDFFYELTRPFRNVWWWFIDLLPKPRVEVRTVVVRRDSWDDWDDGWDPSWP